MRYIYWVLMFLVGMALGYALVKGLVFLIQGVVAGALVFLLLFTAFCVLSLPFTIFYWAVNTIGKAFK